MRIYKPRKPARPSKPNKESWIKRKLKKLGVERIRSEGKSFIPLKVIADKLKELTPEQVEVARLAVPVGSRYNAVNSQGWGWRIETPATSKKDLDSAWAQEMHKYETRLAIYRSEMAAYEAQLARWKASEIRKIEQDHRYRLQAIENAA